jgi:hypothetical protein
VRINVAVPEAHVDAPVLDAALEAVTRLNETLLERGQVPEFTTALDKLGIQWKPEPPGAEHFDHAGVVMKRRWGDCDDLAPWHAASLRHSGEDPDAKAVVYQSGPRRWHAVVQRGSGEIDDPSKEAGMGRHRGNRGASVAPMVTSAGSAVVGSYLLRPSIALRPVYGQWQARADIPWQWREKSLLPQPSANDMAMTTLHTSPVASTALTGAINGAIHLADSSGFADEDHLQRLAAIADAAQGCGWADLAEVYGEDHANAAISVVGSFWGSIANVAKKALPVVSKAVQFIPGVGPVASSALDLASGFIPDGKGGKKPAPGMPGAFPGGYKRLCIPAIFE